jgi:hypothetical protein
MIAQASHAIDNPASVETAVNSLTEITTSPVIAPIALKDQPRISAAVSVASQELPTQAFAPILTIPSHIELPVRKNVEHLFAQPLFDNALAWTFSADAYMEAKLDDQPVKSTSLQTLAADRLEESIFDELADSLARAKNYSNVPSVVDQNARDLALRSFASRFQHGYDSEPEDSDLFGLRTRKRDKLAKKAVDEIHSLLGERV